MGVKDQVEIMPCRPGVYDNRIWQNFGSPFDTHAEAFEQIEYEKKTDAKFPVGYYKYRVVEVSCEETPT
ncbi:hypothetical protein, partial [Bacillus cereus]